MTKTYRVTPFAYLWAAGVIVVTAVGAGDILPSVAEGETELWFALGWFGVAAVFWANILTAPFKVTVEGDGRVAFRSLLRAREVHASQIRRVVGQRMNQQLTIIHDAGSIKLTMPLANSFDFLFRLKELNPSIDFSNA